MTRLPQTIRSLLLATAAVGLLATGVPAATTIFTEMSSFEASLPAGFFYNNFSTVPDAFLSSVTSVTGTGGTPTVGYTITASPAGVGVFPDTGFKVVGNWGSTNDVFVSFNTGNVASAGGEFWISDINGNRLAGTVTVSFSNGTSIFVPSTTSGPFGFAGITTDSGPLTSMTVAGLGGSSYLNMTNFSVAAVPEPSSLAATALAVAALAGAALRRRV